jgi:hypothetical protein
MVNSAKCRANDENSTTKGRPFMTTTPESEKVLALVTAWLSGDYEEPMYDACTEEPEIAWKAILELLTRDLTKDQHALLAAGPMEDLLWYHGFNFIDRVEQEAKVNVRFNHLLGGVWRREMPQAIWDRVERARKKVW